MRDVDEAEASRRIERLVQPGIQITGLAGEHGGGLLQLSTNAASCGAATSNGLISVTGMGPKLLPGMRLAPPSVAARGPLLPGGARAPWL